MMGLQLKCLVSEGACDLIQSITRQNSVCIAAVGNKSLSRVGVIIIIGFADRIALVLYGFWSIHHHPVGCRKTTGIMIA